jgi:hypothetical protein
MGVWVKACARPGDGRAMAEGRCGWGLTAAPRPTRQAGRASSCPTRQRRWRTTIGRWSRIRVLTTAEAGSVADPSHSTWPTTV